MTIHPKPIGDPPEIVRDMPGVRSLIAFRRWWRLRRATRPLCIVSTPQAFSLVGSNWRIVEDVPYGRGHELFVLADRLEGKRA